MPVQFTINGDPYEYPEGWQDVTLSRFMESLKEIPEKPAALVAYESCETAEEVRKCFVEQVQPNYAEIVQFYLDYVHFWTGIDKEFLGSVNGGQVQIQGPDIPRQAKALWIENLYIQIRKNFINSQNEVSKKVVGFVEFDGEKWYLPEKHMTKETVNAFIECGQYEHNAQNLGNQLSSLPDLICVLLRKEKGAPYKPLPPDQYALKRSFFMRMTMDKVWNVSFFLSKQSAKLAKDSLISMAVLRLNLVRHRLGQA
jgi:hypothetical protein